MALNSNALVLLADAKTYLNITVGTYDTLIEGYINACSQSIERITKRTLVNTAGVVEYHSGKGTDRLVLREWPITSVTDIRIDSGWEFLAASVIDATEYAIYDDDTTIIKKTNWPRGRRNIQVTYDHGLGTTGAMPSDLMEACYQYVSWFYSIKSDRRIGEKAKGKSGETTSFSLEMPAHIQTLIEPYIRHDFNAGDTGILGY